MMTVTDRRQHRAVNGELVVDVHSVASSVSESEPPRDERQGDRHACHAMSASVAMTPTSRVTL